MEFTYPNFYAVLPEIFVFAMACIILIVDVYLSEQNRVVTYLMTQATLVGAAVLTLALHSGHPELTFHGMFISDAMGDVLKMFLYLTTFVVFLYSRDYLAARGLLRGEFFVLGLFALLGMMVMVSAYSMLTLYLGLELMSLALYAMSALNRDSAISSEAAMKYFVLGALASGLLLYGMSMIYGATGSLNIQEIGAYVLHRSPDDVVLLFGLAFVIVGLAFKLGAVPFHMWIPDVYHGTPTAVTLYISTAPKIATFAIVIRFLIDGLGGLQVQWQDMLVILAAASIALGNVVALAQTNIKRLLAYSTISHIGFMLLGILTGTVAGYAGAMFYILVYALMTLGAFGMVVLLSRAGFEAERLEDFKGLNERSPWFAFMMLIIMFSTAGIPPTVGFYAKLAVLRAVVDIGMVWLAVYAVIFSVIGAAYYLRVVKYMYFEKPDDTSPVTAAVDVRAVLSANGLVVLALGIYPAALMALCAAAVS
ncbi:MAG: NADH-quinone oxidoreductase subunit NuoN [Gammaproteobacteria bacterium]|jgi:NADH-quinone oxidoreductase subunit N|nr:NADH-quinone oxidoreductase subunit NuoN [Gammaproteobacteria bacterium]